MTNLEFRSCMMPVYPYFPLLMFFFFFANFESGLAEQFPCRMNPAV